MLVCVFNSDWWLFLIDANSVWSAAGFCVFRLHARALRNFFSNKFERRMKTRKPYRDEFISFFDLFLETLAQDDRRYNLMSSSSVEKLLAARKIWYRMSLDVVSVLSKLTTSILLPNNVVSQSSLNESPKNIARLNRWHHLFDFIRQIAQTCSLFRFKNHFSD